MIMIDYIVHWGKKTRIKKSRTTKTIALSKDTTFSSVTMRELQKLLSSLLLPSINAQLKQFSEILCITPMKISEILIALRLPQT